MMVRSDAQRMKPARRLRLMSITAMALALAACGGGGGTTSVATIPSAPLTPAPTPPAPTPTPSSTVTIFANPVPTEYAVVGSSLVSSGGNLDTYSEPARYGEISTVAADQPSIRYTSTGIYEVKMPGQNWDGLVPYKGLANPTSDNNYFQPASVGQNYGYLVTSSARKQGFLYSELGGWGSAAAGRYGYIAFGTPTPAGGLPTAGTASYNGIISGNADVMSPDYLYGGYAPAYVNGTVALSLNFGSAALTGAMTVGLDDKPLGSFSFRDTVYSSAGGGSYSGQFATSAAGSNYFFGLFTGPAGQETIGTWALPFLYAGDGKPHQAFGAWIAKQ